LIICQNCGTTNNENVTRVCRTCGALLPVPSKQTRVRTPRPVIRKKKEKKATEKPVKVSTETEKKKKEKKVTEKPVKVSAETEKKKKKTLELQEIPKEPEVISNSIELHEIPSESTEELETNNLTDNEAHSEESDSKTLQEITPQPFKGSILDSRKKIKTPPSLPSRSKDSISDAFLELKNSVLEKKEEKPSKPLSPIPEEPAESDSAVLKQKQLEKDMTEVLGFLSKKISVKKLEIPKAKPIKEKVHEEKIPPSSMNEILKQLLTLDLNIEASAIIKIDGTILASAISSRISDSLFATIGMNLSMIGTDIIEGLDAGVLKSISVRGSEGVVDLAPIDQENPSVKDMLLILFSHPKVKSGIIAFAVNIVKNQLKDYLGIIK
jgi:predicted regulator of Ras-like GTPase activity (Roadblock/LC7/MglB family)